MKRVFSIFFLLVFFYTNQTTAVFCTAQEYVHPQTGNSVWLFGDIHCDVEPMATMTRLQQHVLLEEASKRTITLIAENVDYKLYDPYEWIIPFGIDAAIFYKAFQDRSYTYFVIGAFSAGMHLALWRANKNKTQKPGISLTDHIAQLRKNSTVVTLPLYSGSPLWSLVQEAEKRDICARDLEFRYHMQGAYKRVGISHLPTFLKSTFALAQDMDAWVNRKVTDNEIRYPLKLSDYCRVNDAVVQEIQSYEANAVLQKFYQECIATYEASYMTILLRDLHNEQDMLLAEIIPLLVSRTGKNTATILKDFTEHNMTLFDARLLHSIVSNQDTNIFVCTGVYHVDKAVNILEQLGYQAKRTYGKDNLKMLETRGVIDRTFIHLDDLDYFAIDLEKVFAQE